MAERSLYDFTNFSRSFTKSVDTIVELGARDCTETLEFHNLYKKAQIYTFECNPNTLPICRKRVGKIKNIHLIEKAVTSKNGTVKFFPINKEETTTTWEDGNQGASSLFKASGDYPVENYVQDEVTVEAITLAGFFSGSGVKKIDLMWMDIQGAELDALKGLHEKIRDVKMIHLELEFMQIYKDQPLYKDLKKFLNRNGFLLCAFTNFGEYASDGVFVNIRNIPLHKLPEFALKNALLYRWKKSRATREKMKAFLPKQKSTIELKYSGLKTAIQSNVVIRNLTKLRSLYVSSRPVFSLRRMISFLWFSKAKRLLKLDQNTRLIKDTLEKIDVIIPVTSKDFGTLPLTVKHLRNNLRNPIKEIFIVAKQSKEVSELCEKLKCTFIDESRASPLKKSTIKYISHGIDRSGWLLQQLIKLNADTFVSCENYLVIDADTLLVKTQNILVKNRPVFNHSDEYHKPYFEIYHKLTGLKPKSALSFVAHYMLLNKNVAQKLKSTIQKNTGKVWFTAIVDTIDQNEFSAFSEYETYGNFYLSKFKKPLRSYWFNQEFSVKDTVQLAKILKERNPNTKSISFHAHEKI